jgi:hypothetical protein
MKKNLINDDVKDYFKKMRGYEIDGIIFYDKKDLEYYIRKKVKEGTEGVKKKNKDE